MIRFDIKAFITTFAQDKQFKSSLIASIEYLQNSINLEDVKNELEQS